MMLCHHKLDCSNYLVIDENNEYNANCGISPLFGIFLETNIKISRNLGRYLLLLQVKSKEILQVEFVFKFIDVDRIELKILLHLFGVLVYRGSEMKLVFCIIMQECCPIVFIHEKP